MESPTSPTSAPTIDDLDRVAADAVLVRKRLAKLDPSKIDLKTELADNLYPILEGLVDAVKKRLADVEDEVADLGEQVDEMNDQVGEVLHPETAGQIVEVFTLGDLLASELEQLMPKLDDLTKKRVRQIVKSYRQGVVVISQVLAEITMPVNPDASPPQETPEGEAEREDDDEGEDDEGEEDDEDVAAEGEE